MTTPSSDIVDLFMSRVDDYRLDIVYNTSGSTTLTVYTEPWLMSAIADFENFSDQSLVYTQSSGSATEGYFTEDLNVTNKIMLSRFMTKYWLEKSIKNLIQMQNHVTDRDFKTFSAAQNLKSKQDFYNSLQEELSQAIIDYSYHRNNWTNWNSQIFS
jgi:hypothetical protein